MPALLPLQAFPNSNLAREKSTRVRTAVVLLCCLMATIAASAQKYEVLDAVGSYAPLIQGLDGNLYGINRDAAGTYGNGGSVVKLTPTGAHSTVYTFCAQSDCTDGLSPNGVVLGTDGNFYGTTEQGGSNSNIDCNGERVGSCGTVFKLTPGGELTTLYNFCKLANCADGSLPVNGLVQGTDGNFYGTTWYGGIGGTCNGSQTQPTGCGTAFKITPKGELTTLYQFCSSDTCTADPSGLVQGKNGTFYGTTNFGGTGSGGAQCGSGCGVFYSITSAGVFTTLYSFCVATNCPDGAHPQGSLVQASNGDFYGVANGGGANNFGTVFKIGPGGALVTLYSFCAQTDCPDGGYPEAGLIQATDGNFYGSTSSYGKNVGGTLFRLSGDKLKTLYNFCSKTDCNDGDAPSAPLFQATNGNLYGTAGSGGTTSFGTIFELLTDFAPSIETIPTAAKVAAKVTILGNDLTGATAVSFNGTSATFTVVSATEITTTVPTGATTGNVTVTTSGGGTLTSNVSFLVK